MDQVEIQEVVLDTGRIKVDSFRLPEQNDIETGLAEKIRILVEILHLNR